MEREPVTISVSFTCVPDQCDTEMVVMGLINAAMRMDALTIGDRFRVAAWVKEKFGAKE